MRFHAPGLIVLPVIVLLVLVAGAVPTVAVLRVSVVLYVVAAFLEVVINMVRYRDTHVRSRLFRLLFQSTCSPWEGFSHWRGPDSQIER